MTSTAKIYIVEDDLTLVHLLKEYLSQTYQVKSVDNFRAILQEIREFQPDLILMDLTLPYFNGFYWTTEIRKYLTVPILFISSASDDNNAIMAMHMGGDDFINKPFSLPILDAKITAFLRRSQQFERPALEYKDYCLSLSGLVTHEPSQKNVQLTPTETKILTLLLEKKTQIVSKEDLLTQLWEKEEFIDRNTLHVNITRLRKKLSEIDFHHIHTIRGVGYLLQ